MAGMWNTLSAGLQIVQNKLDHVLENEPTGDEKEEEVSGYIIASYPGLPTLVSYPDYFSPSGRARKVRSGNETIPTPVFNTKAEEGLIKGNSSCVVMYLG